MLPCSSSKQVVQVIVNFKRAATQFFFVGILKADLEIFKRDRTFQVRLEISIEIEFFQSLDP